MPDYPVIQWLSAIIIQSFLELMYSSIDKEDWMKLSLLLFFFLIYLFIIFFL